MTPFWKRTLQRSGGVALALAVVGFILAKGFLVFYRVQSGSSYNPENERVLWQTPLVMAGIGVLCTAVTEALAEMFRRPAPQVAPSPPSRPTS